MVHKIRQDGDMGATGPDAIRLHCLAKATLAAAEQMPVDAF